jgi:hypothetical protein
MKQYKYSALTKLMSASEPSGERSLPATGGRVVVRARHHQTGRSKMFSALISNRPDQPPQPNHSMQLTLTVVGNDVPEYLDAGDSFTLWRGREIGQGVISRRLSWLAEGP